MELGQWVNPPVGIIKINHESVQFIINLNMIFSAILGRIPLVFTSFWGDQPAVNGRCKLPRKIRPKQWPTTLYRSNKTIT